MRRRHSRLTRSFISLSLLATVMLLFACEGPTGPEGKAGDPGAAGTAGAAGAKGDPGPAGAKGTDVDPAVLAAIQAKLDAAGNVDVETCSICHAGHGMKKHQAIYNKYIDSSDLALFWVGAVATDNNDGTFNTTVTFKITRKGLPYEDIDKLPSLDQKTFYSVKYDAATRTFDGSNSF